MIDLFLVPEFQQHAAHQGSQENDSEVPDLYPVLDEAGLQ